MPQIFPLKLLTFDISKFLLGKNISTLEEYIPLLLISKGISHRRSNYLQHLYQLHDFLNKYPSIVFLIAILFHQNIAIR